MTGQGHADARSLAASAVDIARESLVELKGGLEPFVVAEELGVREVERFGHDDLEGARARIEGFVAMAGNTDRCALVHLGQVGLDEAAILIEIHHGRDRAVEVFYQRFEVKGHLLPRVKLAGKITRAGEQESLV